MNLEELVILFGPALMVAAIMLPRLIFQAWCLYDDGRRRANMPPYRGMPIGPLGLPPVTSMVIKLGPVGPED